MKKYQIRAGDIQVFAAHLRRAERSSGTVENYLRHVRAFAAWLGGRPVTGAAAADWKASLVSQGYRPSTVNTMLVGLNGFFQFMGWEGCKVRALRLQRRLFREDSRELTRAEYDRLTAAAHALGRERLALLMEAICATGIRVSEVRYLTVEAVERGRAEISLKGKIRTILIPGKLRRKLLKFAQKNKTVSGEIFLTRNGKSLGRRQIWAEMKRVCREAGVVPSKVFPHNLRHLFATTFYRACKDIVRLADVLGHSSIDTTRIYLMTTGEEHARLLEGLRLIS